MRLGILSTAADSYSTRRLAEAAQVRGHEVYLLDTLRLGLELGPSGAQVLYRGVPCAPFDVVVPRIGASISRFGLALVRQFERLGTATFNCSEAIASSRDKLRALQLLSRAGLPVPETAFVRDREELRSAIERIGGPPVIIKLLEGTQGVGVILAESLVAAEATVEALHSARAPVLIQRFIQESRGRDVRVIVIGGRCVAAMRRTAAGDEFRSNVHRGGRAEGLDLSPEYAQAAEAAARVLGLDFAGVDLLEGRQGPLINEVNSSPGLEGIEGASRRDVAGAVVLELERRWNPGSTVPAKFGHLELAVEARGDLAGRTLGATLFGTGAAHVLSLERRGVTLPLPHAGTRLQPGDRLSCFGDLSRLASCQGPLAQPHQPIQSLL